jgi:NTE family protein
MYNSLALGGGGSRGFIHIGALRALQEVKGSLDFPQGIYGQSIGAIVATALAFRVPLDDLERVSRESLLMSRILPELRIDNLVELSQTYGLFTMDSFEAHLLEVFDALGVDLRDKLIRDTPQKLFVTASNITTGKPCILTGEVPILKALRCSACIPFLFRPETLYGHLYVDGAIYSRCIRQSVPESTLIFQISGGEYNPTDFGAYIYALVAGPAHQYKSDTLIHFRNIPASTMRDATPEEISTMISEGYSQARAWLAERIPEK